MDNKETNQYQTYVINRMEQIINKINTPPIPHFIKPFIAHSIIDEKREQSAILLVNQEGWSQIISPDRTYPPINNYKYGIWYVQGHKKPEMIYETYQTRVEGLPKEYPIIPIEIVDNGILVKVKNETISAHGYCVLGSGSSVGWVEKKLSDENVDYITTLLNLEGKVEAIERAKMELREQIRMIDKKAKSK